LNYTGTGLLDLIRARAERCDARIAEVAGWLRDS
jgi:hypothetical protein